MLSIHLPSRRPLPSERTQYWVEWLTFSWEQIGCKKGWIQQNRDLNLSQSWLVCNAFCASHALALWLFRAFNPAGLRGTQDSILVCDKGCTHMIPTLPSHFFLPSTDPGMFSCRHCSSVVTAANCHKWAYVICIAESGFQFHSRFIACHAISWCYYDSPIRGFGISYGTIWWELDPFFAVLVKACGKINFFAGISRD